MNKRITSLLRELTDEISSHVIVTNNGQGKALKCLHCDKFSRLKLKKGLMNFAKELAEFERIHQYCKPKIDGRGKQLANPSEPKPHCLICGKEFEQGEGKVPLYRNDQLSPAYGCVRCVGVQDYAVIDSSEWLYSWVYTGAADYQVGHHNIVVRSECEWLYFWRGECGVARNKAEAIKQLEILRSEL